MNESALALRTSGNSAGIVQLMMKVLPALVLMIVIGSFVYLVNSLRTFRVRPIRGSIAPLLVLYVRYVLSKKLPPLLEPVLNSSYSAGNRTSGAPVFVADLHADTMLWTSGARSIHRTMSHPFTLKSVGSTDIPRFLKGGVGLQVFAAVTSVPKNMNFDVNEKPKGLFNDLLMPKIISEWPMSTWNSCLQRALYQAERLIVDAAASKGKLFIMRTGDDVNHLAPNRIGGVLAIEGMQVFESLADVETIYAAGYRMVSPTHFFDTKVGGSSTGVIKGGLTDFGRQVMRKMRELNVILDVSHSSLQLIEDVVKLPDGVRPNILMSHAGVREICNSTRNYPASTLQLIASTGGLVGIALFDPAICGHDLIKSFVDTVVFCVNTFGADFVALGSDWDGATHTAVDAGNAQILAEALRSEGGLSEDIVRKVMGENTKRFLAANL